MPRLELQAEEILPALKCVLSSADANWYLDIATQGYHAGPYSSEQARNWVFFPLVPTLIHLLTLISGRVFLSGFLLSNFLFFVSLILIQRLAELRGFGSRALDRLVWLICFFPTSYFFSAPLTESTFFCLSIFLALLLERREIVKSGIAFAVLTLCRPTGALLGPAYLAALYRHRVLFTARGVLTVLISGLGLLSFAWYLTHLTGNPLAFKDNQMAWGRNHNSFLDLARSLFSNPGSVMSPWNFVWMNLTATLVSLGIAALWLKRGRLDWALWLSVPLLFALSTGVLDSTTRFAMSLFPLHIFIAEQTENPQAERVVMVVYLMLFASLLILYGRHVSAAMA